MIYSGIRLDFSTGKASECPRCHNTHLIKGSDFCQVCGAFLVNRCTGLTMRQIESDNPFDQTLPADGDLASNWKGCEGELPNDARFCTQCGCLSTLFAEGLLKPWNEEKPVIQEISTQSEDILA